MRWSAARLRAFPRHVLLGSLVAGLAAYAMDPLASIAVALAAGLVLLAITGRGELAVAVVGLFLAGGALGDWRVDAMDADPLSAHPGGMVELRGFVVKQPRVGARSTGLRVQAQLPRGERQTVEVRAFDFDPGHIGIGDEVIVTGRIASVASELSKGGDSARFAAYLLREGVLRRVSARSVVATGTQRGGLAGWIDGIRDRSERAMAVGLPGELQALLRGMVLGGDSGIPEPTVEAFRVAGLAHILAVSGQNVLLIVILAVAMLTAVGAGRRTRIVVPAVVIAIYVPLCGMQASVLRAGVMGLAALAAIAASRPASRIYAVLLAAAFLLVWNPRATADIGAQLSFAAVLGIMAFTGPIARWGARRVPMVPGWAHEALAATAGATLATAPLMAMHFGRISVVSLIANVLATPLIGGIVWLGSLTAAIGQISLPVAALLNAPNAFLLGSLIELARGAAAMPGAEIRIGELGVAWLIASFAAIVFAAAVTNGIVAIPGVARRFAATSTQWQIDIAPIVVVPVVVCVALLIVWPQPSTTKRPGITMLDVGQGDAILLHGRPDCDVLIDGGPDPGRLGDLLGERRLEQLDLVVITHAHDDHFAGLAALTERKIDADLVLDGGGGLTPPTHREIVERLRASGAEVAAPTAGGRWSCGDIAVQVVAPRSPPVGGDPNDQSVALVADVAGTRILATGDAESSPLSGVPLPDVDVLKVAHHGSEDQALASLLQRTRPELALISSGRDNRHGHPHPTTLAALTAAGVPIRRTDREGTVELSATRP